MAFTAIYKPEVDPLRIPGWKIMFSGSSLYVDVIKHLCELGAPDERQIGNMHHETGSQTASVYASYLNPFTFVHLRLSLFFLISVQMEGHCDTLSTAAVVYNSRKNLRFLVSVDC